ncbi:MAG: hypothetical protein ACLQVX_05325 [Limisphaerales bacterium]
MKLTKNIFLWAVVLAASAAAAAEQPLARLSVRSFTDLTNAVSRVASNLAPNETQDHGMEFSKSLGITNLTALDAQRPWEIALWYGEGGQLPLLAIKAPVENITQFKESLSPAGALRDKGREWTQLGSGVGLIVFRDADSLSEAEKAALDQWKAEAVAKPARLLELKLNMTDSIREKAAAGVAIGKAAMTAGLAAQNTGTEGGPNPANIQAILAAYFDVIDSFIAGLQGLTLRLDLSADALTVENSVTAKPGTDLAGWLRAPAGELTAQDLGWVGPDRLFSIAGYVGNEPWVLKLVQKMIPLALQVQNVETNGVLVKDLGELLPKMLPVAFGGSMDFKDKFTFAFSYRFPAGNVADIYGQTKRILTNDFQTFVGKDKMYSAATLVEKHETINGIPVDRLSVTLNLDSPLFKMPGQKEQLQMFYPDGKMEVDYAIKGDRLLSASADRMKELLSPGEAKAGAKSTLKPEKGTCLAGYVNVLGFVGRVLAGNPAVPQGAKDKLAKLDGQGAGIEFQVSMDDQMHAVARVPLKLFRELGRLKDD